MKTAVPTSTLSAALLALQLCKSHGFVVAGNARVSSRSTSSCLGGRDLNMVRRPANSSATCRMATEGGEGGEPKSAQGFGLPQEASGTCKGKRGAAKISKKTKGVAKVAGRAEGTAKETAGANSQRNMLLQFQCGKCDTVSQYMIGKVAYEDGIVICTCKGCQARHLIADNLKKMDFPEFGDNIEDYMNAKGMSNEVTRAKAPNFSPEVLEKYDLSVGEDGTVNLSPKGDRSS